MFYYFVVQRQQSFPEMQDGIPLSRDQRVLLLPCQLRDLLKGEITQFVPDKDGFLLFGQLVERFRLLLPVTVDDLVPGNGARPNGLLL